MQFRTSLGGEPVPSFVFYAPSAVSGEDEKPVPGAMASHSDSRAACEARPVSWMPPTGHAGDPSFRQERLIAAEAWSVADGSEEPQPSGHNPHVTAVLRISRHYLGLPEGDKQRAA
jgi:hypothetical protein